MLTLMIWGTLIGVVLGMRFGVLILIASIVFGLFAGAVAGVVGSEGFGATVLNMVLIATALQLGYLGGTMTRFIVAATRTTDVQSASRAAHQS
jgi:hypothetical protein